MRCCNTRRRWACRVPTLSSRMSGVEDHTWPGAYDSALRASDLNEGCRTCRGGRKRRLAQQRLSKDEGFRVALGRPAFHASQAGQAAKYLGIEPILGALRAEAGKKQADLAIKSSLPERGIDVGLRHVAVPLWDLILQNQ